MATGYPALAMMSTAGFVMAQSRRTLAGVTISATRPDQNAPFTLAFNRVQFNYQRCMADTKSNTWRRLMPYLLIMVVAFAECAARIIWSPVGIVWDEPYYLNAGRVYWGLHDDELAKTGMTRWQINHEHPPLAKIAIGLGEVAGINTTGTTKAIFTGGRLVVAAMFALALAGLFALARPLGAGIAWTSVILAAGCPRFVGHGEIATLDVPLTAMWIVTLAAVSRAVPVSSSIRWTWVGMACLMAGLAMLTKFGGVLLPGVVLVWLVWRRWVVPHLPASEFPTVRLSSMAFLVVVLMAVAVWVILIVGWPWLWDDTAHRLVRYVRAQLDHRMTPVMYFGHVYGATFGTDAPPWHYAVVMTLITTPALVSVGVLLSLVKRGRLLTTDSTAVLVMVGGLIFPFLTMVPGSVVYDGVRNFLPAIPLLCIPAAIGWHAVLATHHRYLPTVLAILMLVFSRVAITDNLSYYNLACGGPPGARAMGMDPCYWATGLVIPPQALDRAPGVRPLRVALLGLGEITEAPLKYLGILPLNAEVVTVNDDWDMALVTERLSLPGVDTIHTMLKEGKATTVYNYQSRVWPLPGSTIMRIVVRTRAVPNQ
jgi:4-amino-4-deoxy-L-arabinose transferase-like glycosyltransferase